ncbi:MAG: aspartate-semialdehyde dehydrogenase [Chloroflexi bacterium]|nr:aspartate-semialdehyde dehydrogenase [Chloroflexota bacterium]
MIAVVGATGAVGLEFLKILEERSFPVDSVRLLASKRSVGKRLTVLGRVLSVEEPSPETFRSADIVFISASAEVSKQIAPVAIEAGAVVIDDSSFFRMNKEVPLVVPEINGNDLRQHRGLVAIPNCSTTQMVMALYPLHRVNPVRRVIVDTYQAVSGTGKLAIEELREQSKAMLDGGEAVTRAYPHPIAFNLLPQVDSFMESGYTKEEWKMAVETRKILHAPELPVSATCVRVPVYTSHSEAVHVELSQPMAPQEARKLLAEFPGVKVVDNPERKEYPMPRNVAGTNDVFVGRIRQDVTHPRGLAMWVVADNLRKGAALNAIQIAESLLHEGLLKRPRGR